MPKYVFEIGMVLPRGQALSVLDLESVRAGLRERAEIYARMFGCDQVQASCSIPFEEVRPGAGPIDLKA